MAQNKITSHSLWYVGGSLGRTLGGTVGCLLEFVLGATDGGWLGSGLGSTEGCPLRLGDDVGCLLGFKLRMADRIWLGSALGSTKGCSLGRRLGDVVGCLLRFVLGAGVWSLPAFASERSDLWSVWHSILTTIHGIRLCDRSASLRKPHRFHSHVTDIMAIEVWGAPPIPGCPCYRRVRNCRGESKGWGAGVSRGARRWGEIWTKVEWRILWRAGGAVSRLGARHGAGAGER